MSRHLPRYHAHQQHIEDERKLARILLETGDPAPTITARNTHPLDESRLLRGIPVVGGVSGTSPGTDPYLATANKLMPRRRHAA